MADLKLSTYAKAGAIAVGKVLLPVIMGVLLNWGAGIVFIVLWMTKGFQNTPLAILCLLTLGAAFPFGYFWLAKSSAIKRSLRFLYQSSESVTHGLMDNAVGYMIGLQGSAPPITKTVLNEVKKRVNLDGRSLPRGMGRIVEFIMNRLPLGEILTQVKDRFDFVPENRSAISQFVSERVDTYVKDNLLDTDSTNIWILALLNIGAIVAAWYYVF